MTVSRCEFGKKKNNNKQETGLVQLPSNEDGGSRHDSKSDKLKHEPWHKQKQLYKQKKTTHREVVGHFVNGDVF